MTHPVGCRMLTNAICTAKACNYPFCEESRPIMTKTVEDFEAAMNAAVDPWVTTLKSATMLASIMMKPLVKELEESDIDPELKKALFDRVIGRFTEGVAAMEAMFDDD